MSVEEEHRAERNDEDHHEDSTEVAFLGGVRPNLKVTDTFFSCSSILSDFDQNIKYEEAR